jgi:hypothetical protein
LCACGEAVAPTPILAITKSGSQHVHGLSQCHNPHHCRLSTSCLGRLRRFPARRIIVGGRFAGRSLQICLRQTSATSAIMRYGGAGGHQSFIIIRSIINNLFYCQVLS